MKAEIHPTYFETEVSCLCGNSFTTRSTVPTLKVEICSACHPLWSGGKGKILDAAGRVDKFNKRYSKSN